MLKFWKCFNLLLKSEDLKWAEVACEKVSFRSVLSKRAPSKQMNKASARCVETPELAQRQECDGDAAAMPGRLPIRAGRQGRVSSRREPLALRCALTCAEGCTENSSSRMSLKVHSPSPGVVYLCPAGCWPTPQGPSTRQLSSHSSPSL